MSLATISERQLQIAMDTLALIEERSDDVDSRNAAQHALVKIRRLILEDSPEKAASEAA